MPQAGSERNSAPRQRLPKACLAQGSRHMAGKPKRDAEQHVAALERLQAAREPVGCGTTRAETTVHLDPTPGSVGA